MVKIQSQNMVFDNGALDMAMNLVHIYRGEWTDTPKEAMYLDFRSHLYEDKNDRWKITGFELAESFVDRNYKTGEVEGYAHDLNMFPIEKLTKWDLDGFIKYPIVKINSVKFYPDTCKNWREDIPCITIEIDSDNDEVVEEIFMLLGGLANGGHCCGGHIRINQKQMLEGGHVANFGLDGDGCDRIYYVNGKEIPE